MANVSKSKSSGEVICTPLEIQEVAANVAESLLPKKSRELYEKAYSNFMAWKSAKNITSMSERVFLVYFKDLSSLKTSTLWSLYSKLNAVLKIRHNLNIENFYQLKGFLKKHGENYLPKQAAIFSAEEIEKFLKEAPDSQFLAIKVVCIFGIKGACRNSEILNVTMSDINDYNEILTVKIPITKINKARQFIIDAEFYRIVKKYIALRPEKTKHDRFFIKYQNGKCATQVIGIHKICKMPQEIASFLNLPNPTEYTGHSFRRTSTTLLVDAGGTMESLKRHGGWKSYTVAERYVDVSLHNTKSTAELVTKNVHKPSTSRTVDFEKIETEMIWEDIKLKNNHEKLQHPMIEPSRKKFKSNKTPSINATEQNINLQNTEVDTNPSTKKVTIQFINCSNMSINLKE